jgi:aminoglycoside phosphotransferase (APT) family kinase protein
MTAVLRARHAIQAAGLPAPSHAGEGDAVGTPVRVSNSINEVWQCGSYMLRVNPRPGATRLQREAKLLQRLPVEVRAPHPVAVGIAAWGEWLVTVRLPGLELSRLWRCLRPGERQRAITDLAAVLQALHRIEAPTDGPAGNAEDCPHPLPVDRLLSVLARAGRLPGVDRGVIVAATERVRDTAEALDDQPTTLVHGDLHLENVLSDARGRITGLLDFEWSQAGPPDLDLDVLIHSLAEPALHVQGGDGARLERKDFDDVLGWLRDAYPALFAHPRLADRLWIYRLAYEARALVADPPPAGSRPVPPHHPYARLRRLVEGRSDLLWFLPAS